MIFTKN